MAASARATTFTCLRRSAWTISKVCSPGATDIVSGVTPLATPSDVTSAPAGSDSRVTDAAGAALTGSAFFRKYTPAAADPSTPTNVSAATNGQAGLPARFGAGAGASSVKKASRESPAGGPLTFLRPRNSVRLNITSSVERVQRYPFAGQRMDVTELPNCT